MRHIPVIFAEHTWNITVILLTLYQHVNKELCQHKSAR